MRVRKALALAAALVLTAMVLSACGDDDATDTTQAPTTTAATTTSEASTTTMGATTTTAATTTTGATDTTAGGDTDGTTIEVTIQSTSFDKSEIRVPAGEEVTIVVHDEDPGADEPHNFHVRAGDQNFFTNIEPAPNTQEITFSIDEPGEYEFFCDTHPVEMNGTFIVEEPGM